MFRWRNLRFAGTGPDKARQVHGGATVARRKSPRRAGTGPLRRSPHVRRGGRRATTSACLLTAGSAMIIAVSWAATAQGASVVPVAVRTQAPPSGPQLPASLTLSSAGAAFIASFEGFGATPYDAPSPVRDCVIGYGHVIHSGPCISADFEAWGRITAQQG